MSDLQDIKLVPRNPEDPMFANGRMTIEFDDAGDPLLLTGEKALEQDVLKNLFTRRQVDGYGTYAKQLLGEKNIGVAQAMIAFSSATSCQILVRIHKALNALEPIRFRGARVLTGLEIVKVLEMSTVITRVRLAFTTQRDSVLETEAVVQATSGANNVIAG